MQARPVVSALVFALVGCGIGDNDAPMSGGGDGGGTSVDDPEAGDDSEGDGSESGGDGPAYPHHDEGGEGEGEAGGEASDGDAESGGEYDDGCGDGALASHEQCDDGNDRDGDGCDNDCRITIGVSTFDLGGAHTCAIDYFGELRCWGDNSYGQLGYASLGLDNVGANVTPKGFDRAVSIGAPVAQVELGMDHTCARSEDGHVYCWGRNDAGQLGYGHTDTIGDDPGESPTDIGPIALPVAAIAIAAGKDHTCALLDTGALQCWGEGARGQLGIAGGFSGRIGDGKAPYPSAAAAPPIEMYDVNARALSIGVGEFGCVADQARDLHCWGANESGQLGLGTAIDVGVDLEPMKLMALIDDHALRFAVGGAHVCLLTDAFEVRCFGRNDAGQLGYARVDNLGDDEMPLDGVVHLDGHLAVGVATGADFSCARLDDATVRCWGDGMLGQLGNGHAVRLGDDENPADSPAFNAVPIVGLVSHVIAGAHHVCARSGEANLHCWGSGADGRLGYGDELNVGDSPASLPVMPVPIF